MKEIKQKIVKVVSMLCSLSLVMPTILLPTVNAATVKSPTITDVEENKTEDLALTVKWTDNNPEIEHFVELKEETTGQINRLSSTITEYTYQGLDLNESYKVKIRACTSDKEEDCSAWSGLTEKKFSKNIRSIILNYKKVTLLEEKSQQLEVIQFIPSKSLDSRIITWTSSNEEVAEVDEDGLVTGVAVGETTVTATTVNGVTAKCKIIVTDNAIPAESISLDKTSINFYVEDSESLTVKYVPSNTTETEIEWTSSNEEVAEVDEYGTVTGVDVGTAIITAKTETGKTATCNVTVTALPEEDEEEEEEFEEEEEEEIEVADGVTCKSHQHLKGSKCVCDKGYTMKKGKCKKTSSSKKSSSSSSKKSSSKKTSSKKKTTAQKNTQKAQNDGKKKTKQVKKQTAQKNTQKAQNDGKKKTTQTKKQQKSKKTQTKKQKAQQQKTTGGTKTTTKKKTTKKKTTKKTNSTATKKAQQQKTTGGTKTTTKKKKK